MLPLSHLSLPVCFTYRETKVDCTLYGGESKPNDESSQYVTGDQLPPMGGCLTMQALVEAVLSNVPPNITAEFPRMQRGDDDCIVPSQFHCLCSNISSYHTPPHNHSSDSMSHSMTVMTHLSPPHIPPLLYHCSYIDFSHCFFFVSSSGPAPSQSQGLHTQGTATIPGKSKAPSASSSKSSLATSTVHPQLPPIQDIDISSQSAPPSRQKAVPAQSSSAAAPVVVAAPPSSTKKSRSSRSHPTKANDRDDVTTSTTMAMDLSAEAAADAVSSSSSSSSSHAVAGTKAAVKGSSPPSTAGRGKNALTAPVAKAVKKGHTDGDDVGAEGGDEDEEVCHDSCAPSPPARAPRGMD